MTPNSPPSPGPDLFFAGGECLTRFGVWVRRTDMDLEAATREAFTRNSIAEAIGRDGILRTWDPDEPRAEWLNEIDLDPTRNLLSVSEDFLRWTTLNADVESDAIAAPDGKRTADKLIDDFTAGASHRIRLSTLESPAVATEWTFSYFVKAAEYHNARVYIDDGGANNVRADADLEAGTITGASNSGSWIAGGSSIVPIGGGWFRISVTGTSPGSGTVRPTIFLQDGTSYDGDGVSGFYIWGAQLERGSAPTAYQATPRDTDRRFPSLFLEDGKTNQWTNSAALEVNWNTVRASFSVDAARAPDGSVTAEKLVEDSTAGATHLMQRNAPTITASQDNVISLYARAAGRTDFFIETSALDATIPRVWFNLLTGQVGTEVDGAVGTIRALPDGWFRVSFRFNSQVGGGTTTPNVNIFLGLPGELSIYGGDGVSGVDFWGLQFELNQKAATSYVPTGGTTEARLSEHFQAPFPHPPQELTGYAKFVESGTILDAPSGRIFQLAPTGGAHLRIFRSTNYRFGHDNGDGLIFTALELQTPTVGDLVEHRALLYDDGSVQLGQTLNGGEEELGSRTGPNAFAAAWGNQLCYINSDELLTGTTTGQNRHLAVKMQRGVRSLDFMRQL